jgi:hypothetical protein
MYNNCAGMSDYFKNGILNVDGHIVRYWSYPGGHYEKEAIDIDQFIDIILL